jgi:GT2 family glycosyltransferase
MKAHIQIVGWNHHQYIGTCVLSCLKQTVKVPVLYIDNASVDGSVDYIREKYPSVEIIENKNNRGYAGGHNDGLKKINDSEIVILLNPDVVLEENFVEEIIKVFENKSSEKIGAVVPLLLRTKERDSSGQMQTIVDAYGTKILPSMRAVNCFENKPIALVEAEKNGSNSLWGFTGAAVALFREAINDLSIGGEFFDEKLHSYREDVDASWRLQNRGWKIVGNPNARAWHARTAKKGEKKSAHVLRLSWRNYFFVIIKNASRKEILQNIFPLSLEIIMRVIQFIVTPALWAGIGEFFTLFPVFLKKRRGLYYL